MEGQGNVALAISPSRVLQAISSQNNILLQQPGKEFRMLEGHTATAERIVFSPDERQLLSDSPGDKTIRLWDIKKGAEIWQLPRSGHPYAEVCVFGPNGQWVAQGMDGGKVLIIPTATGEIARSLLPVNDKNLMKLAVSPDGSQAVGVYDDSRILVWDFATGQIRRNWRVNTAAPQQIDFTSDGRHLLASYNNGVLYVFRLQSWPDAASRVTEILRPIQAKRSIAKSIPGLPNHPTSSTSEIRK